LYCIYLYTSSLTYCKINRHELCVLYVFTILICMEDINKYIQKPYEQRITHLDLQSECIEVGGNSTSFKGLLSYILGVTIPSGSKILLCHKCHNGKCSKPKHLYYGTPTENIQDQRDNGTWKTTWERMVDKYGLEEAKRLQGKGNKSNGGKANKGKPKSAEHRIKISQSLKNKKALNN
jgi:hypothetical protein